MHKTIADALKFADEFVPAVKGVDYAEIVIAPVFTALYSVGQKIKGTNVEMAAQDVYSEEKGAFTGEVAPHMLIDAGCGRVIIGHSERREYFNESDEIVNKKTKAALKAGLKVIFCIGESLKQRQAGETNSHLAKQITEGLRDVRPDSLVIAYEPIWAIGTGVTATPEQAEETHAFIRKHIASIYGEAEAGRLRILYGGSVKPENIKTLMDCPDIDGALVGGASLDAAGFSKIVKFKER